MISKSFASTCFIISKDLGSSSSSVSRKRASFLPRTSFYPDYSLNVPGFLHQTRYKMNSDELQNESKNESFSSNALQNDTAIKNEMESVKDESDAMDLGPLVQHIVIRRDLLENLNWPTGSVITQGCHACISAIWQHMDDPNVQKYCQDIDNMHKVVLEVKGETQLLNFSEKLKSHGIKHKLWIEQPENFPTCLATVPNFKSLMNPHFKKLKLFK